MEFLDTRFSTSTCRDIASIGRRISKKYKCKSTYSNTVSTLSALHALTFISFQSFQLPGFLLLFLALKGHASTASSNAASSTTPPRDLMAQEYTPDDSALFGALGETTGGAQGSHESEHKSQKSDMATTTVCSIKSTKKRKAICFRIQSKMNGAARGDALVSRVIRLPQHNDHHAGWTHIFHEWTLVPPVGPRHVHHQGSCLQVVVSDGNCERV